jgi:molecular chaperone DnaK
MNNGTVDQIKEKTDALTEKFHIISTKLYQQAQAAGVDPAAAAGAAGAGAGFGGGAAGGAAGFGGDDNVVDADYEVVDEE